MTKKLTLGVAVVAALAIAITAVGVADHAVACDKNAKATTASSNCSSEKAATASGCSKSAAAQTASASGCSKSAGAKTASASGCTKSAAAKTASAGCCEGKAAVAGYSKAGKSACGGDCSKDCCDADAKHAAALKGIIDDVPYAEPRRLVVAGTMECGSCTYKATASCQPLIKTTDGKVYPLMNNSLVKSMRMKKHKGATSFKVTSNVRKLNGVKYLDVKAFSTI